MYKRMKIHTHLSGLIYLIYPPPSRAWRRSKTCVYVTRGTVEASDDDESAVEAGRAGMPSAGLSAFTMGRLRKNDYLNDRMRQ